MGARTSQCVWFPSAVEPASVTPGKSQAVSLEQRVVIHNEDSQFADVKCFDRVENAMVGRYFASAPNGIQAEFVLSPNNDKESYVKLRVLNLSALIWEGQDQLGKLAAKAAVEQNDSCIFVKNKHTRHLVSIRNESDQFTDVKCYDSIDNATVGRFFVSIPNGTKTELVAASGSDRESYATIRIIDLDQAIWEGQDEAGRRRARDAVQRNGQFVLVKIKHTSLPGAPL